MTESISDSLRQMIRDLCVTLHTEFYSSKEESDESMLELDELLNEDPESMMEHIVEAVSELINIKHQAAALPEVKENSVYQKALQKLEAEVRQHIKVEHQLKLHVDELNYKIEKLKRDGQNFLKRVPGDAEIAQMTTDDLFAQTTDLPLKNDSRKLMVELAKHRKQHRRDSARILELETKFKILEEELKQVKNESEQKDRELQSKTTDIKRARLALTSKGKDIDEVLVNKLAKEISFYKSRYEGKCLEVSSLEAKLKLYNDRKLSDSKTRHERRETTTSGSPGPSNKSLRRKKSEGTLSGTLSGTVRLPSRQQLERSHSNERLRKAYREAARTRASMVLTYKSNAK